MQAFDLTPCLAPGFNLGQLTVQVRQLLAEGIETGADVLDGFEHLCNHRSCGLCAQLLPRPVLELGFARCACLVLSLTLGGGVTH